MAARGATDAKRAKRVRIGRDAGSHSVDRIVSIYFMLRVNIQTDSAIINAPIIR